MNDFQPQRRNQSPVAVDVAVATDSDLVENQNCETLVSSRKRKTMDVDSSQQLQQPDLPETNFPFQMKEPRAPSSEQIGHESILDGLDSDCATDGTSLKAVNDENVSASQNAEDKNFYVMLEQLKAYKAEHGDCIVPLSHENVKLVRWCLEIRDHRRWYYRGKATNLDEKKLQILEDLNFAWDDARWLDMYVRLKNYKNEHGDILVPNRYTKDKQLGQWVSKQRQRYRMMRQGLLKGKSIGRSEITPERVAMLESLGMVWDARPYPSAPSFNEHTSLSACENQLHASNGIHQVPYSNEAASVENSVASLNNGSTAATIKTFSNAPFTIRPSYDQQWDIMLARLMKYKEKFGHVVVPNRFKEDPPLGQWVSRQRQLYRLLKECKKPSTMTHERVKKLESIGFIWDGRCARNNGIIRKFPGRDACLAKDSPKIDNSSKTEMETDANDDGTDVKGQYRNCYMSYDQQWYVMLERLMKFKTTFGHCLVPNRYESDKALGQWVSRQRRHYRLLKEGKASNMTTHRISLLEEIGFVWSARDAERTSNITKSSMNDAVEELVAGFHDHSYADKGLRQSNISSIEMECMPNPVDTADNPHIGTTDILEDHSDSLSGMIPDPTEGSLNMPPSGAMPLDHEVNEVTCKIHEGDGILQQSAVEANAANSLHDKHQSSAAFDHPIMQDIQSLSSVLDTPLPSDVTGLEVSTEQSDTCNSDGEDGNGDKQKAARWRSLLDAAVQV